jgi:hypothetical protein
MWTNAAIRFKKRNERGESELQIRVDKIRKPVSCLFAVIFNLPNYTVMPLTADLDIV